MTTTLFPLSLPKHSFARRASVALSLAITLLISACNPDPEPLMDPKSISVLAETYSADVATKWADVQLRLIKNGSGFSPPVAARALGYCGVALYETVVPGMPDYQSLAGQLTDLTPLPQPEARQRYNWNVAANAAEALMVKSLFGNASTAQRATIDSMETALNQPYRAAEEFDRSVKFGQKVAQAVFDWSKTDGGHEGYLNNQSSSYVPPVGVGLWVPTSPGAAGLALQPKWGDNRRFVPANAALPMPGLAYTYSKQPGSAYYKEVMEVYTTSRTLTPEQRVISAYWADAGNTITPPGHMVSIASILLRDRKASLATAGEAYARVGMAVADAFMGCWKCKYVYNWERPVTAIRAMIDPTWNPDWETPPFPEFVSGHATQSAAAAQVLSDMFGPQTAFTDYTHQARGAGFEPRPFTSLMAFANESAMSRLYGGIHFRSGNDVGLTEGVKVGRNVSAVRFRR